MTELPAVRRQIAYHRFQRVTITAAVLLALAACHEFGGSIDAPAPVRELSSDPDSLPALPPGIIVAPLSLDLAAALAALERAVPKRFGSITHRIYAPESKRKSFAFLVQRDPFAVAFARDTVILASVIHYRGRAWYNPPIGPELNGECGTNGEPPRARLVVRAVPHLTEGWKIQVRARLAEVSALTPTERDQCQVSFLHVDVTRTVLEAAGHALEKILPDVERKLARLDVRKPLASIWNDLQKPIRLSDSLWLLIRPVAVNLGPVRASSTAIVAEIGVTASPRIVSGGKPGPGSLELPHLGMVHTDQGFSLLMEGNFGYGVMGAELTTRLAGHSVKAGGGVFAVNKVTVFGLGAGRLALGVDFEGSASGQIWLVGKPSYDAASGWLSVPDLDFDARSAGMLVQGLAWLKADAIREFLRSQARISAGAVLDQIRTLAVKELNRELARGVRLSATIEKTEPAGILVRSDALIIRARATGAARLDLGPEIFVPKPGGSLK